MFNIIKSNNNVKIQIFKSNNIIMGELLLRIHSGNIGTINNIYIDDEFKKKGYGSKLLNKTEIVSKKLNIKQLNLTAWSEDIDNNLCYFYFKNNYKLTDNQPKINVIDNYDNIYYLYNLYKNI